MGRKPTKWLNLPKGMRARPRGLLVHYYLDTGERPRREIPLGSDYAAAVVKWAELTIADDMPVVVRTFPDVVKVYRKEVLPTKAASTRSGNEKELQILLKFFGDPPAPLDKIEPKHIKQYLAWRVKTTREAAVAKNLERRKLGRAEVPVPATPGSVRANREVALFSHVWNWARGEGYTKLPNPCVGVKKHRESGRDVFVDDALMARIMEHADEPLRFAMRLANLTGQRPSDVRAMSEAHVMDGALHVRQGKTKAKLRIVVEGELAALLTDLQAYKAQVTPGNRVRPLALLVTERGEPLTRDTLRSRFDRARLAAGIPKAQFQFRDLRARAATEADDADGTKRAQGLLGHATEAMTADYIRHKAGKKVRPLR